MNDSMDNNGGDEEREAAFRRNTELERLLKSLNRTLGPAEENLLATASDLGADHPLVFIMGPLRSGTTLFMQWLASSGIVAYPSNLLSRFYAAPAVGAQIQLLLTDPRYNFRDEILDFTGPVTFDSENGKTIGEALGEVDSALLEGRHHLQQMSVFSSPAAPRVDSEITAWEQFHPLGLDPDYKNAHRLQEALRKTG